ncbi:hypothetical protein [Streptomyces sp. ICC1]|uniref:hypothetical protein n=1 Tax=Streptomyces sp. ICC1 TaxID=2099583 RepID=UPI0013A6F114|nr:hypothetical protein [Streptomyces sp. ICC1]
MPFISQPSTITVSGTPSATSRSAPVNSTQWCVPLNFGEWLSKLVGKQSVCVKVDWGRETGFWPF